MRINTRVVVFQKEMLAPCIFQYFPLSHGIKNFFYVSATDGAVPSVKFEFFIFGNKNLYRSSMKSIYTHEDDENTWEFSTILLKINNFNRMKAGVQGAKHIRNFKRTLYGTSANLHGDDAVDLHPAFIDFVAFSKGLFEGGIFYLVAHPADHDP